MKDFTEREILLQVKRVYSKDEIVTYFSNQNKQLLFEIGILKSENSELKHENNVLNWKINRMKHLLEMKLNKMSKDSSKYPKVKQAIYEIINNINN